MEKRDPMWRVCIEVCHQAASSAIPHRVKSNNVRLFFIIELEAAPHGFNYKDNIFHEVEESRTIGLFPSNVGQYLHMELFHTAENLSLPFRRTSLEKEVRNIR